jgi:hypothetical protein
MGAERGPRRVDARRVACLAIPTISGAVRDDPNRRDGMVALLKEIYGREPRPHDVVLRERACRRRPAVRRVTAPCVAVAYGVLVVFAEACLALALVLVLWYT